MRKIVTGFILLPIFILIFSYNTGYGATGTHELGKLKIVYADNALNDREGWGGISNFWYPNGFYRRDLLKMWQNVFVAHTWINTEGVTEEDALWTPHHNHNGVGRPIFMKNYRKHTPPAVIADGLDVAKPYFGQVDGSLKSDTYVEWKYYTADVIGLENYQETWSYVNENHDDYLLIRQNIMFTGNIDNEAGADVPPQTIELAWYDGFAVNVCEEAARNQPSRTGWHQGSQWYTWDTYKNYMDLDEWPYLVTNRARDDLYITYMYPADNFDDKAPRGYDDADVTHYYDQTGVPDPQTGMFLGPTYAGMAIFHVDKSASDASDDALDQPRCLFWQTRNLWWRGDWEGGIWNFITDASNRPGAPWEYYNAPENNLDESYFQIQGVGPRTMAFGDNFTANYAIGCGSIDEDLCYTEGEKYWNWYWDKGGATLDNAGKNALIATGKDSLFVNMNRANWATFTKNYDIPDPLGAPDIEVSSGPDKIDITWGYPDASMFKDPDTGQEDFLEWRLYRKKGSFEVDSNLDLGQYNNYVHIGTFDKGTTSFFDNTATRGVAYHYCVTAVDDGSQNTDGLFPGQKLESSFYANRTALAVYALKPGLDVSDEVVVVPNPYSLSTGLENELNWPGAPNEVKFLNLPAYCTLRIYTVTGDLIKTIEHTSGSGDERWENLRTDTNQYPVSGVYILYVDNARDLDKNFLSDNITKFVIIR